MSFPGTSARAQAYARGVELPPLGSVEDRVIREVVYRERSAQVAHVRALAGIVAHMLNMETDRAFGGVIADYAAEVYQESYDPILLRQRAENLRRAQAEVAARRRRDEDLLRRIDKMGEYGKLDAKIKK